jgi:hypothetical protein
VLFAAGYDSTNLAPVHLRTIPTLQKPIDGVVLVSRLASLIKRRRMIERCAARR